jgi:hypothetical protein
VPHAIVQDVAASWVEYERVAVRLLDPPPRGLIVHVAGPTDEGLRTIEVWESKEAWGRFRVERLAPAIAALSEASRRAPVVRELRAAQLMIDLRALPRAGPRTRTAKKGET